MLSSGQRMMSDEVCILMKHGLVMEGGAMRGMFTAGIIDVFLENDIKFDGAIGVSAGAVFGCNLKSRQIGRSIRYNKKYCRDRRYVSFINWMREGELYPPKFCYEELPNKLDKFDVESYKNNPMDFYVVSTDVATGEPTYTLCNNGDADDIQWFRASASMPVFSKPVNIGEGLYSDGGTSDSVPLKYLEKMGYNRILVILTQPKDYRKKPYKGMAIISKLLAKYPMLIKAMKNRHIMYNDTMDYIDKREKDDDVYVIRPSEQLKVKPAEKNPDELERVYQLGRKAGYDNLDKIKEWLCK